MRLPTLNYPLKGDFTEKRYRVLTLINYAR
jgi:hypothetical protein